MLRDIDAVIFDVDGTILDSNGVWQTIDEVFMDERGLTFSEDFQREIDGLSFHQVAEYCHDVYNLSETPDELIDIWHDMAREQYAEHVDIKPGAYTLINHLKSSGMKLAIASSNSINLIEPAFLRHGIYDLFDYYCTASEIGQAKDDPLLYLDIASKLCTVAERILVFDDILPVIEAVRKAGMRSCVILDKRSLEIYGRSALIDAADYYINDFTDIDI